ncbi:MAG: electron transfer flavoprotein subunit beta/FixA family protein [Planctomycetota bacterium]|jgi:electron transfer flavoprotein beta subunit
MRILTLAMQVPDSRVTIKVAPGAAALDTRGVKFVCNPFDEFAVEQAVRLKEARSDVEEVVALTIGAPDAVQAVRAALAMGADRAIHVCDETPALRDELFLAEFAAAAIRRDEKEFDLILCGKQTIDRDAGELGPALAEFLGWPHVGAVARLEVADDGGRLRAHRRIEGAEEVVESPLPVLVTCEKGLVEPRYPSLPNLIKAKKKPMDVVQATDLPGVSPHNAGTTLIGLAPPPPRPACKMLDGQPQEMARELIRLLREEAKVV